MKRLFVLIGILCSLSTYGDSVLNLEDVTDSKVYGRIGQDELGRTPTSGCDFNRDGYQDLLFGTDRNFTGALNFVYLVFGGRNFPEVVDLANPPEDTLIISDFNSYSTVAGLGDFNGDGYEDAIVGDGAASPDGVGLAGQALIVYGGLSVPKRFSINDATVEGVKIKGSRFWGFLGFERAISSAGDVNGDGFADALLGSPGSTSADPNCEAFIIYGGTDVLHELYTHQLGKHGVRLIETDPDKNFGFSVSGVGDINKDGIEDVAISNEGYPENGIVYLIYGATDLPSTIETSSLGNLGVKIIGTGDERSFGTVLSPAGDINHDGYADFMTSDVGSNLAGRVFIILGAANLPSEIQANTLGSRGIIINGLVEEGIFGRFLAPAGDINGDGHDDILVASRADPNGVVNQVHLIFGGPDITRKQVWNVDELDQIIIQDTRRGNDFGTSASLLKDINGDGRPEIAIGDFSGDPLDREVAGTVYIIYGGKFLPTATPTDTPTLVPTVSPSPVVTLTPTPTYQETGEFSGWILSGDGEVKKIQD